MELSYTKMGRETQDFRINEIVLFLRRIKVLSFSWGKIHSDEVFSFSHFFNIILLIIYLFLL